MRQVANLDSTVRSLEDMKTQLNGMPALQPHIDNMVQLNDTLGKSVTDSAPHLLRTGSRTTPGTVRSPDPAAAQTAERTDRLLERRVRVCERHHTVAGNVIMSPLRYIINFHFIAFL